MFTAIYDLPDLVAFDWGDCMRLVIFVLIVCSLRIDRDITYTFIDILMCRTGDANFYKSKTTHSQQHSLAQYRN